MSGLFSSDSGFKGPTESQARADALALGEQERSEQNRVTSIQRQLSQETTFSSRGYGLRSLFGQLGTGRSSLLGSG